MAAHSVHNSLSAFLETYDLDETGVDLMLAFSRFRKKAAMTTKGSNIAALRNAGKSWITGPSSISTWAVALCGSVAVSVTLARM